MSEDFDEFAQQHSQNRQNSERLAQETKPEWAILKGLVSRFALDGKEFCGHKFEWAPYPAQRPEFLRLKDVAVLFLDHGERNGVPQNCRVRFTRRPPEQGRMFAEEAPLEPVDWLLNPQIESQSLTWSVPELGETISSAKLAEKIAIELSKYHAAYEEFYGRWPTA